MNFIKEIPLSKRAVLSIVLLVGANQLASAATCTSSGTFPSKTVTASLDSTLFSSVGSSATDGCTAMALGNLDQFGPINVFGETWTLIQKDVLDTDTAPFGALTITDTSSSPADSKSGDWSIDLSKTGSNNLFVIGLKPDGGFAYYNVGSVTSGTYGTLSTSDSDLSHGLSHANLYGRVSAVPLPAAAWLFGTALIGFIGMSRKTKV